MPSPIARRPASSRQRAFARASCTANAADIAIGGALGARAAQALADGEQPRQQRRDRLARKHQQPGAQRDRLAGARRGRGRPFRLAGVAPGIVKERRRHLDRRAPAIVALRDGQPRRSHGRRRVDQQDQPQPQPGREQGQPGRGQLGAGDVQARRPVVHVEPRDVRHDRRDVRADVGRLGQDGRVAGESRFEPVPRVTAAGQQQVVLDGPVGARQRDGEAAGRRPGARPKASRTDRRRRRRPATGAARTSSVPDGSWRRAVGSRAQLDQHAVGQAGAPRRGARAGADSRRAQPIQRRRSRGACAARDRAGPDRRPAPIPCRNARRLILRQPTAIATAVGRKRAGDLITSPGSCDSCPSLARRCRSRRWP